MSSRSEIRFNFRQALAQADRLDALADRLGKITGKTMENSMQMLTRAWKGDNANAFLRKEENLRKDIKGTAADLHDIADDIRRIARRVYEAEMEAWRIANERDA